MSKSQSHSIGVIGAGSWGTALSCLMADDNPAIYLWAYERETVKDITNNRENRVFLPGIRIPDNVKALSEIEKLMENCKILMIVTPVQNTRSIIKQIKNLVKPDHKFVLAGKGIEKKSSCLLSEIIEEELGTSKNVAILSGPTFALEVAQRKPTAAVVASSDPKLAKTVQSILHKNRFRIYQSKDIKGVQLAGAIKNVISIAGGIADGMRLGLNARAALICRGLEEMKRLGVKLNGQPETFSGLAGLGDLILTATGSLSRNHELGFRIGEGISPKDLLKNQFNVVEGVPTSISLQELCREQQVEMPISETVYSILHEGLDPNDALFQLLERKIPGPEIKRID